MGQPPCKTRTMQTVRRLGTPSAAHVPRAAVAGRDAPRRFNACPTLRGHSRPVSRFRPTRLRTTAMCFGKTQCWRLRSTSRTHCAAAGTGAAAMLPRNVAAITREDRRRFEVTPDSPVSGGSLAAAGGAGLLHLRPLRLAAPPATAGSGARLRDYAPATVPCAGNRRNSRTGRQPCRLRIRERRNRTTQEVAEIDGAEQVLFGERNSCKPSSIVGLASCLGPTRTAHAAAISLNVSSAPGSSLPQRGTEPPVAGGNP